MTILFRFQNPNILEIFFVEIIVVVFSPFVQTSQIYYFIVVQDTFLKSNHQQFCMLFVLEAFNLNQDNNVDSTKLNICIIKFLF